MPPAALASSCLKTPHGSSRAGHTLMGMSFRTTGDARSSSTSSRTLFSRSLRCRCGDGGGGGGGEVSFVFGGGIKWFEGCFWAARRPARSSQGPCSLGVRLLFWGVVPQAPLLAPERDEAGTSYMHARSGCLVCSREVVVVGVVLVSQLVLHNLLQLRRAEGQLRWARGAGGGAGGRAAVNSE